MYWALIYLLTSLIKLLKNGTLHKQLEPIEKYNILLTFFSFVPLILHCLEKILWVWKIWLEVVVVCVTCFHYKSPASLMIQGHGKILNDIWDQKKLWDTRAVFPNLCQSEETTDINLVDLDICGRNPCKIGNVCRTLQALSNFCKNLTRPKIIW